MKIVREHINEEIKYCVYLTTNLINGKQYVGDHSGVKLEDTYYGSGALIKLAIKKYGRKNFKKEILGLYQTKKEAFDAQEKYIQLYNTLTSNGYNISLKGGHQTTNSVSDESKEKMKIAAKSRPPQTEETKRKRREALKGHIVSNETKEKIKAKQKKINKLDIFIRKCGEKEGIEKYNLWVKNMRILKLNMSQETKNKISVSTKLAMQRPEVKEKMKNASKGRIPWNKKKSNDK